MTYFVTEEQEKEINEWIDEENKIYIESLLKNPDYPEEEKEKLRDNLDRGLDTPPHKLERGYYTVSFTPTPFGNRIYVHHHLNNVSAKVFDVEDMDGVEIKSVDAEVLEGESSNE